MNTAPSLPPLPPLPEGARVWLAFSGGLDSTVLLHLLHAARVPGLGALHVHHGLQDAADDWAGHCRAVCRRLKLPCEVLRVQVAPGHPAGPEAAARQARYDALQTRMSAGDLLATAHHLDDQAETVLLRLLRGAGVTGLAAMRSLTPFGPGRLWRPLLALPRAQLHAHALARGWRWVEDPHNQHPRYARSFLRQQILPRLHEHWPQAEASLARAAAHCAEAVELLDELARQDLAAVQLQDTLSVAALLALSGARRRNALRCWLASRGYPAPDAAVLERLDGEVLRTRPDAQPLLHCGAYEFRRYRDRLYLMPPLAPEPQALALTWDGRDELALPAGCGRLVSTLRRPQSPALVVRFPGGGERLRPTGTAHTRTLKNLFQEAEVPPWQRLRTPLLYRDGRLLAVADRWLSAEWAEELARRRARIRWFRDEGVKSAP